eukprot:s5235_g1.t1
MYHVFLTRQATPAPWSKLGHKVQEKVSLRAEAPEFFPKDMDMDSMPAGTVLVPCVSQWALPDFNRELQISVGTAGIQPRAPDPSGHCRTSTARSRSQWALPDFSRELQIPVGTAGLQPRAPDPRLPEGVPLIVPTSESSWEQLNTQFDLVPPFELPFESNLPPPLMEDAMAPMEDWRLSDDEDVIVDASNMNFMHVPAEDHVAAAIAAAAAAAEAD